ncbi:TPA: hypothetical protein QIB97_002021 [Proteus mirabilis]|nr:hypothetical protein [Proteus mirabilis]
MKIDTMRAQQVYSSLSTVSRSNNVSRKELDPIIENLKLTFYQNLNKANLSHVNDILNLLNQFDVNDGGNQTLKEKRQIALLVYAHQQSELEHHENKNLINQALISRLSYQGFYHQVTQELLGMIDNNDEFEGFFKPDSPTFSL